VTPVSPVPLFLVHKPPNNTCAWHIRDAGRFFRRYVLHPMVVQDHIKATFSGPELKRNLTRIVGFTDTARPRSLLTINRLFSVVFMAAVLTTTLGFSSKYVCRDRACRLPGRCRKRGCALAARFGLSHLDDNRIQILYLSMRGANFDRCARLHTVINGCKVI
jgi:hypothetical protein